MKLIRQPVYDTNQRPFIVIWETTQACDLACKHCRAEASPEHDPEALTFEDGKMLVDQVEQFGKPRPMFILTGGDPLKHPRLFDIVQYAASCGLPVAVSPSGTPLLTIQNLQRLKDSGTRAISLSLDGSNPELHDNFRQVPGAFDWTINGWKIANDIGLKVQINTTITRYNLFDLPDIFALVREIGAMTWSAFFLVPTGRGTALDEISPEDHEAVMHFLYDASKHISVKTTEGHHFKRVVLQRAALEAHNIPANDHFQLNSTYDRLTEGLAKVLREKGGKPPRDRIRRAPMHINAASGFVFISLKGDVFPSGYLPLCAGNIRETPLKEIYQSSELFISLRDGAQLKGRCGQCEFRQYCGGSRSRAYALTGDVLAEEPFCIYQPGAFPYMDTVEQIARGTV